VTKQSDTPPRSDSGDGPVATVPPPEPLPPPVTVRRTFGEWLSGSGRVSNIAIKIVSLVALIVVWHLFSVLQGEFLMPGPRTVAERLGNVILYEDFTFHMWMTLRRVIAGLLLSLALAVVAGVPMGLFRPVERFLETYVLLGLTIPGLAWALIAVMVVGISEWAPIVAIVATTTPMIMLNLWHGTKSIDMDVMDMGKAFRARRRLVLRHVVMPQLLPFVMAGTRLGLALAWKIVVLSEMFGLSNGIGYQLNVNFSRFSLSGVMAWTIAFTMFMAAVEFLMLKPIENHLTRWRPSVQGA
jgi:NitT/TauT family transport system permease protein